MIPLYMICASVLLLFSDPTSVERWSQTEPQVGEIVLMDEQGIHLRMDGTVLPLQIAWYDIRNLEPSSTQYSEFRTIAQNAWRAHLRLERGDYTSAEIEYARLAEQYLWKQGLESADVSLGLMRCRLDREDRASAVLPFLSWLGSQTIDQIASQIKQEEIDGYDSEYRLMTYLPPVFGPEDRVSAIDPIPELGSKSIHQQAYYELYRLAYSIDEHKTEVAEKSLDEINRLGIGRANRDAGFEFMKDMVTAQAHPVEDTRRAARDSLNRKIKSQTGSWIEMWARLGLGISLLDEEDVESNERGVIELIHVIVRFQSMNPNLAETASQIANEYLVRTNRTQWGSELLFDARSAWMERSSTSTLNMESATDE